MVDDPRRFYRIIHVTIFLALLVAGLVLTGLALTVPGEERPLLKGALEHLSSTFIVGAALGLAYEFFLRNEILDIFTVSVKRIAVNQQMFEIEIDRKIDIVRANLDLHAEEVTSKLSVSKGSERLGLCDVQPHENIVDYSNMIKESQELYFVFNDGRTWFSTHEADLADRLSDESKKTIVILNHKDSLFLDVLSSKVGQSRESLSLKISETVDKLTKMRCLGHDLQIFGHKLPSSYSLILSESTAVMIPYLMARKGDRIPCFSFSYGVPGGFYDVLRKDLMSLINDWSARLYPVELPFNGVPSVKPD